MKQRASVVSVPPQPTAEGLPGCASRVPFEAILESMSEMIVYHDDALKVLWANRAAADFVDLTPEEMVGRDFFDVTCQREESCPGCPVVKGPSSEYLEVIENSLLTGRLYFTRSYPLLWRETKLPGRFVVAQDISDMRNKYGVTEILNHISQVFHSPGDVEEIYQPLIGQIASHFDYPAGVITLHDEQTQEIISLGEFGFSNRLLHPGKRYPLSRCFSEEVLKDGSIVNLTGLSKLELEGYILKEAGAETILAVPLQVEKKVIGTIVLVDFRERLEKNLMIDGLKAVANRLGVEIHRKQTAEKLQRERNFTNTILNNAVPFILVLDQTGKIVRFNKACQKLTGYSSRDVLGKFFCDLFVNSKDLDFIRQMFPLSGDRNLPSSFESRWVALDGSSRQISWSNSTMEAGQGNSVYVVLIGMDITDIRRAEEEAELRRRQLLEADKMASLGVLASGVAHEINNPNNFIMMNTPILRKSWADILPILDKYYEECGDFTIDSLPYSEMREEIGRLFAGIEAGSERIRKIIENMKQYARREFCEEPQSVDLNVVVMAAMDLLAHEIRKSTVALTIELYDHLPLVKGLPQRLEQVLVNLIQNACQALTERSQAIHIRTFYEEGKKEVSICIGDEGVGVRPEHLQHIFAPFFTTKAGRGGTGLGLSVCLEIVKEHNGRLEFFSEFRKGTEALLSFPAAV